MRLVIFPEPSTLPPSTDTLYHYTSLKTAIDHILTEGRLRFTPLAEMDDPREKKELDFLPVGLPELPKRFFVVADLLNMAIRQHSKIVCFCQDNMDKLARDPRNTFERGCSRSRMWSQYADKHTGLCMAFSKKNLGRAIRDAFQKNSTVFQGSVNYRNASHDFLKARTIQRLELHHYDNMQIVDYHLQQHYRSIFFEKAEDYRDEREYRWVTYTRTEGYEFVPIRGTLKAIVTGAAFIRTYEKYLEHFAAEYSVPLLRVGWHNGRPHLSEKAIR